MLKSGVSTDGYRIYNDVHYELAPELLDLTERTVAYTASKSQHYISDTEPEIVFEAIVTVLAMIDSDAE